MNFCPGELILELLARIGEWHQNLSEKTASDSFFYVPPPKTKEVRNFVVSLTFDNMLGIWRRLGSVCSVATAYVRCDANSRIASSVIVCDT